MQLPINRRIQRYPKEFLAGNRQKKANLYTFNHAQSAHGSVTNQYNINERQSVFTQKYVNQTNPEQGLYNHTINNRKIYYDAQSQGVTGAQDIGGGLVAGNKINKNNNEQYQYQQPSKTKNDLMIQSNVNNGGSPVLHTRNSKMLDYLTKNLNQFHMQNQQKQQRRGQQQNTMNRKLSNIQQVRSKLQKSGTIIRQSIHNKCRTKSKSKSQLHNYNRKQDKEEAEPGASSRVSQKQFNRFGLSLMGVKRAKYNQSCLDNTNKKKLSFSVHEVNRTSPQRFKISKQAQQQLNNQIYRLSMSRTQKGGSNLKQSPVLEKYKKDKYKQRGNSIPKINEREQKILFKYKQKEENDTEIYQHTYLPFRAKKIQELKEEVNFISNASRLRKTQSKNQENKRYFQNQQIQANEQIYNNQSLQNMNVARIRKNEIKINIKSSLSNLKNLLSFNLKQKMVTIQLPQFFIKPPSQLQKIHNFDPQVLNSQCIHIFSRLDIPIVNINIKKYSNCLVIINHNICIVWHEGKNGKKYIGSWKNKYFDQGDKEGLGLQWSPGRYVYYGQFKQNKRNGFGLMRKSDRSVILGYWKNGKQLQFGIQKNYAY